MIILPSDIVCIHCKKKISPSPYCPNCGSRISQQKEDPSRSYEIDDQTVGQVQSTADRYTESSTLHDEDQSSLSMDSSVWKVEDAEKLGFTISDQDETKISFSLKKSGFIAKNYEVFNADGTDFLLIKRSALNKIILYILFFGLILTGTLFVPPMLSLFPVLEENQFILVFSFFVPSILLVAPLFFLNVRRMSVMNPDGSKHGTIRLNLLYTKFKIRDFSNSINVTLKNPFRSKQLYTPFGLFLIEFSQEERWRDALHPQKILVKDTEGVLYFSIASQDFITIRERFRIESNEQLSSNLVCLAAICLVEKFFTPVGTDPK